MRVILAGLAILTATPASAEVVGSTANGFEVRHQIQLVVPPPAVFASFARIGGWWNKQHSYSGNSANLRLELRPGGCFCETLPGGGGVEHLRVSYVDPGKRVVMTGALGPLLYEAVTGVMDVQVERIAGGSRLTMNYRAAGFANGGADKLAPLVDQVLGEQMKRLRSYAAGGKKAP